MARRFTGGIAGWIVGVIPLAAVNIADYFGAFAFQDAVLAGAAALIAGALLCGTIAGTLGGRPRAGYPSGAAASIPAGLAGSLLFAVSVIALIIGTALRDSAVKFSIQTWLGLLAGLLFLTALPFGIALAAGALAGRRGESHAHLASAARVPSRPAATPQRVSRPQPYTQSHSGPRPHYEQQSGWQEAQYPRERSYEDQREYGYGQQPPYRGSDARSDVRQQYAPPSRPARRDGR